MSHQNKVNELMEKTIDFYAHMKDKKPSQYHNLGKAIFEKMTRHDQDAVFNFIREYSLCEVAISRGIIEVSDEIISDDELFKFADKVNDIYSEAAHGCFLCDPKTDPNESFTDKTFVCMFCQRKLENIAKWQGARKEARNG